MSDRQLEKGISDIVGIFADPIVVFPGGWADTIPQWLREAVTLERLIENVRALKEGDMTATDAEACIYLYTACLTQPPDSDWAEIYFYIATKVYERHRTKSSGVIMPPDIRVETISGYQKGELRQLKSWIYEQRVRRRQEKDQAGRRENREQEEARKKQEQPALF
jgi:hypothetical protein